MDLKNRVRQHHQRPVVNLRRFNLYCGFYAWLVAFASVVWGSASVGGSDNGGQAPAGAAAEIGFARATALAQDGTLYVGMNYPSGEASRSDVIVREDAAWKSLDRVNGYIDLLEVTGGGELYGIWRNTPYRSSGPSWVSVWEKNRWRVLGTCEPNAVIWDVKEFQGELHIVGDFSTVDGVKCRGIAKWDGTTWTEVGGGLRGSGRYLEQGGGHLFVGGEFDATGSIEANHIAQWDGKDWAALGDGADGSVSVLHWANGKLYCAGSFQRVGGLRANEVAVWNGSEWSAMGRWIGWRSC